MTKERQLGLWTRVWLALALAWRVLVSGSLAAQAQRLVQGGERPSEPAGEPAGEPGAATGGDPTAALQLLSILQREGRLIDFLQEDVSRYSDAEIGAAARVVHAGCKRGLHDYLELSAVRAEPEGAAVLLEVGFDPGRTRVTGNVVGAPPFRGRLAHPGWQVTGIHLPQLGAGQDPHVVAPAEVEL